MYAAITSQILTEDSQEMKKECTLLKRIYQDLPVKPSVTLWTQCITASNSIKLTHDPIAKVYARPISSCL